MKQLFALMVGCVFALGIIALLMNLRGLAPTPEQYAAATATAQRAADESVRYQVETQATATYVAKRIAVLPTQVAGEIDTENTNRTSASLALIGTLAGTVLCGILILLAVRAWVKRRAKTLSRDQTGQLPAYVVEDRAGNTHLVNLQALPAATVPGNGGSVQIVGLEDPLQILAAFTAALGPTNLAALMSGERTDAERKQRIQIVKEAATRGPDGTVIAPANITVIGDGAIAGVLAEKFNVQLPNTSDARLLTPQPQYPMLGASDDVRPPDPIEFEIIPGHSTERE